MTDERKPAGSLTEALFALQPPAGLTAEEVRQAWDEAAPAKHAGVLFAHLLDAGVKLARPDIAEPVDVNGYTRDEARLGRFISAIMSARETLALAINESPYPDAVLLARSAARLLKRAAKEFERDWESDERNVS
jgi:hypothetical protein